MDDNTAAVITTVATLTALVVMLWLVSRRG